MKSCIVEIEQKQDHLLHRIDSRITTKPKFKYEEERRKKIIGSKNYKIQPLMKETYISKAREIENKIYKKTNDLKKKYLNPYQSKNTHGESIKNSPMKSKE